MTRTGIALLTIVVGLTITGAPTRAEDPDEATAELTESLLEQGRFNEAAETELRARLEPEALWSALESFGQLGRFDTCSALLEQLTASLGEMDARVLLARGTVLELEGETEGVIQAYLLACEGVEPSSPEPNEVQQLPVGTELLLQRDKRVRPALPNRLRGRVFLNPASEVAWLKPASNEADARRIALAALEEMATANPTSRHQIADALAELGLPKAVVSVIRVADRSRIDPSSLKLDEHEAIVAWKILHGGDMERGNVEKAVKQFRDSYPNLAFAAAALEFINSSTQLETLVELAEAVSEPTVLDLKRLTTVTLDHTLHGFPGERARLAALLQDWPHRLEASAPGQQNSATGVAVCLRGQKPDEADLDLLANLLEIEFEAGKKWPEPFEDEKLRRSMFPPEHPGGVSPSLLVLFRDALTGRPPVIAKIAVDRFEDPDLRFLVAAARRDPQLFEKTLPDLAAGQLATPAFCLLAASAAEHVKRDPMEIFAFIQAGLALPPDPDSDAETHELTQQLLKWRLILTAVNRPRECRDEIKEAGRRFLAEALADREQWAWTEPDLEPHARSLGVQIERSQIMRAQPAPGFKLSVAFLGRPAAERIDTALRKGDRELASRYFSASLDFQARSILASAARLDQAFQSRVDRDPDLAAEALARLKPDSENGHTRRWSSYAAACEILGRSDAAIDAYRIVLSQAPNDDTARMRLIRLTAGTDAAESARLAAELRFDKQTAKKLTEALAKAPKETLALTALRILEASDSDSVQREIWVRQAWDKLQLEPDLGLGGRQAHAAFCREMLSRRSLRICGVVGLIDLADADGRPVSPNLWPALLAELTANDSDIARAGVRFPVFVPRTIREVAAGLAAGDAGLNAAFTKKMRAIPNVQTREWLRGALRLHRVPEEEFVDEAYRWLTELGRFDTVFNIWRTRELSVSLEELVPAILSVDPSAQVEAIPLLLIRKGRRAEAMRFVDDSIARYFSTQERVTLLARYAKLPELTWSVLAKLERLDNPPARAAAATLPPFSNPSDTAQLQQLLAEAPFWTDPAQLKLLSFGPKQPSAFNHFANLIKSSLAKSKGKDDSLKNFMIEASGDTFGGRVFRGIVFSNSSYVAEAVCDHLADIHALPADRQDALALALKEELLISPNPVSKTWLTARLGLSWSDQETQFLALIEPPATDDEVVEIYARLRDLQRLTDADAIFNHAIGLQPGLDQAEYARALLEKIQIKLGKRGWGWRQLPVLARYSGEPWAEPLKLQSDVERIGWRWFDFLKSEDGTVSERVARFERTLPYLESASANLAGPDRALFLLFLGRFGEARRLDEEVHAGYRDFLASKLDPAATGPTLVGDLYHLLQRDPKHGEGQIGAYFLDYLDPAWPIAHREAVARAFSIGKVRDLHPSLIESCAQFAVDYLGTPSADSYGWVMQWAVGAVVDARERTDPETWARAAYQIQQAAKKPNQKLTSGILDIHIQLNDAVAVRGYLDRFPLKPFPLSELIETAAASGQHAVAAELLRALAEAVDFQKSYIFKAYDDATHAYAANFAEHVARDDPEFAWFVRVFLAAGRDYNRVDGKSPWKPRAARFRDLAKGFAEVDFEDTDLRDKVRAILELEPSTAPFFHPEIQIDEAQVFQILAQPEVDSINKFFVQDFLVRLIRERKTRRATALALEGQRRGLPVSRHVGLSIFLKVGSALRESDGIGSGASWAGYAAYALAVDESLAPNRRLAEATELMGAFNAHDSDSSLVDSFWESFAWRCPDGAFALGCAMRKELEDVRPRWWHFAAWRGREAGLAWNDIGDVERSLTWISMVEGEVPDFLIQIWLLRALTHNRLEFQDEILDWAAAQPDPKPFAVQQLLAAGAIREDPVQSGVLEAMRDKSAPLAMRQFLFAEVMKMHRSLFSNLDFRLPAADLAIESIEANAIDMSKADGYNLVSRGLGVFAYRPNPRNDAWEQQAERTLRTLRIPDSGNSRLRSRVVTARLNLLRHLSEPDAALSFWMEHREEIGSLTGALNRDLPEIAAEFFVSSWRERWSKHPDLKPNPERDRRFLAAIESEDLQALAEFWLASRRQVAESGELQRQSASELAEKLTHMLVPGEEGVRFVVKQLDHDLDAARILAEAGFIREPSDSLQDLFTVKSVSVYEERLEGWKIWTHFLALSGNIEELRPIVRFLQKQGSVTVDLSPRSSGAKFRREPLIEAAIIGISQRLKGRESTPDETLRLTGIAAEIAKVASHRGYYNTLIHALGSLANGAELSKETARNNLVLAAYTRGWPLERRLALRELDQDDANLKVLGSSWLLYAAGQGLFTTEELFQTVEQLLDDPRQPSASILRELGPIASSNQRWDLAEACWRVALQELEPGDSGYSKAVFELFDARLRQLPPGERALRAKP